MKAAALALALTASCVALISGCGKSDTTAAPQKQHLLGKLELNDASGKSGGSYCNATLDPGYSLNSAKVSIHTADKLNAGADVGPALDEAVLALGKVGNDPGPVCLYDFEFRVAVPKTAPATYQVVITGVNSASVERMYRWDLAPDLITKAGTLLIDERSAATPSTTAPAATTPATTSPAPKVPKTTISSGVYIAGTDIEAGRYKTAGGSSCYYEIRRDPFSGSLDNIIENDNLVGPGYLSVEVGQGVKVSGSCTFTKIP